ncbi:MAG: hypothetical protein AMXMBFR84_00620 [Candidatus Hydrogenedentota bacterium]
MKKKILAALSIALILVCFAIMIYKKQQDAAYYDGYDASLPLNARVRSETVEPLYRVVDFVYDSLPGMHVPTLMAVPKDGEGPYPCIIFLHGIGQKKGALLDIAGPFTRGGFAMVCFDQYTRGERALSDASTLQKAMGLRRRAALNVIDTRRLIDYLETRDDIDANRIYMLGASFGAITGSTAAAFEPRIKAAVLTYGGGDIGKLLSSVSAREELGAWHGIVRMIAASYLAPADPIRHVAEISPRPVLVQNGTDDRLIPLDAAHALFDAAREPKEFVLYESDHIGLDVDQTMQVLEETVVWLTARDREVVSGMASGHSPGEPVPDLRAGAVAGVDRRPSS